MKVVLWILLVVVLAIGGVGAYLYFNSGALLKGVIEEEGTAALGVPVRLGSVSLSLTDGSGQLNNLRIGNPQGFGGGDAMTLGLVRLAVDVASLEPNPKVITINEFVVDAAQLNVIAKGRDTNVQALAENAEQGSSGGGTAGSEDASAVPNVIIRKVSFTNINANLDSDIAGTAELAIPDVSVRNIGVAEGGVPVEVAVERILEPVTRAVTKEVVNEGLGLDEAKERAREKVQEKLDERLKSFTDRLKSKD